MLFLMKVKTLKRGPEYAGSRSHAAEGAVTCGIAVLFVVHVVVVVLLLAGTDLMRVVLSRSAPSSPPSSASLAPRRCQELIEHSACVLATYNSGSGCLQERTLPLSPDQSSSRRREAGVIFAS